MSSEKPLISIVSPVYRAEKMVSALVSGILASVGEITPNFEIILVNDCSPDNSWDFISKEAEKESRVKGVNLSRNFGQHYAITAGLSYAKGEWVIVMDCDLQDRPDEIPKLYHKALEGWDIVFAKRTQRKDSFRKKLMSKFFYKAYNYLSGLKFDGSIANFGIYNAKVIHQFNAMKEGARSFPSLIQYLGYKSTAVDVKHAERLEGTSSYSFATLLSLAGDVILSNSNKPLKQIVKLGFTISIFSFVVALYNVLAYFMGVIKVPGFTTTVFSIWFLGGLILTVLGIIGLYVGKIFDEVKGRQLYIVSEVVNID